MKLFASPASPYVRKVRAVIIETGQADAVEIENITTTPVKTDPSLATANPLGKIPTLIREDGPAIYDSRVITRYLDARSGGKLYPKEQEWEVLTLEATGEAIMDAAVSMSYEKKIRPADKQFDGWLTAQRGKIDNAIAILNKMWMSHLQGPVNIGHITVGCALGYMDFRHGDKDWRPGNDALAEWHAEFSKRECMQQTAPVG